MEIEGVNIDAKSAAIGGVAGLGLGGLLGWLAGHHLAVRRFEIELQEVKDHYDGRLEKLHSIVRRLEEERENDFGRAVQERIDQEVNRRLVQEAGYGVTQFPSRNGEVADRPANDPDGDLERLSTVGLEDPSDSLGSDLLEGSEPGPDDEEVPEVPGPSGADLHAGSVVSPDISKPYQISFEEFGEKIEDGYQTLTITYYAADNVLVDDQDQPIRNMLQTVGPIDKAGFGGPSKDPHIRYVRNHKLEVDFEIVLNEGSYAELILGYGTPRNAPDETN